MGATLDRRVTVRHFERRVMGSALRLTLRSDGPDAERFDAGWEAVSDEFDASDLAMSRFRSDAEIAEANDRAGTQVPYFVSARLYAALALADRARRITAGRFDGRILADLERLELRGQPHPSRPGGRGNVARRAGGDADSAWRSTVSLRRVDAARSRIHRWPRQRAIALDDPVDLGGIGKGLALRWAWHRLARLLAIGPVTGALLEAGGDITGGGVAPDGGPWRIAIEDPRGGDDPLAVLELVSGAICTSSIRVNQWVDAGGRRLHHLVDPATGEPGDEGLLAVTVAGPDPAWAEVWAKALFLTAPDRIGEYARSRGLAAWWVADDGAISMTPAARALCIWER